MRIAVYADVFVRPTETFIYDTAKALVAAGQTVLVIATQRLDEAGRPFDPVVVVPPPGRWHPYHVVRRALRPVLGQPAGGERTVMHRDRIRKALAGWKPDIILANYGPAGVLMTPVASSLGVPLMTSFHGVDASRYLRHPEWRERYGTLFEGAAALTGPSAYVRDRLVAAGAPPERTHVLHYGIPTDRIRFCPPGERYDGGAVRLLFVGRLTAKKDPISLLNSLAAARRLAGGLELNLTMIGDGPLRPEVEAEIARLGLADAVTLTGRIPHDQVIAAYRSAHIYVQHSVTAPDGDEEGLPVSITEALAGGLPVVATRHSGIPEVVLDDVTGYVVDERDVEGMGAAIARLAGQPGRWDALGKAGRRLLEEEFAVDIVQARLQGLLRDAIATSRQAA
jgi:colanic acid/amylovoran biosynthesis glycosyltransferase